MIASRRSTAKVAMSVTMAARQLLSAKKAAEMGAFDISWRQRWHRRWWKAAVAAAAVSVAVAPSHLAIMVSLPFKNRLYGRQSAH
mmetsp:Transcript_22059/g.47736  ORF Transcript_22059/g.47736 Transcript_22059/m.47736 type:complete len:85 (+) Transcript_22059:397-651(+)